MDAFEELANYAKKIREKRFSESNQLSLGEIIKRIENCGSISKNNEPKTVCFDFGSAIPTTLDSWRGDYSELALGYKLTGYDNDENHLAEITVKDLLAELKSAIGKTFNGWKGGEYEMNENTPVWVANPGNGGNTIITNAIDDGWRIILMTTYCEY